MIRYGVFNPIFRKKYLTLLINKQKYQKYLD